MNPLICMIFFLQTLVQIGGGIYDIAIKNHQGKEQSMGAYKGKSMLIALVSPSTSSASLLGYLDSLQRTTEHIQVIVVPDLELSAGNAGKTHSDQNVGIFSSSILITEGMWYSKKGSVEQHALMHWLTRKEENAHFDVDSLHQGQMFLVSENGELYCVINAGTLYAEIDRVIKRGYNL